jgi:hypothetical protein
VLLQCSNNTASEPQPKDAKSTTLQFSAVFLRIPEHDPSREAHIFTLTTKPLRLEKPPPTHSQTTTQSAQEHDPPSFRCVLHCSSNTGPKPKSKDAKSPTHRVSVVFFFGIPANEPSREVHILTLTIRAHRCQKPHAKSTTHQVSAVFCTVQATRPPSRSSTMPRAYPPSFRCVFANFSKRTTASSSHPHMTIRVHRCQTQTTTQSGQEHHPPSFRCVLQFSNDTASKQTPNHPRAPPTKFPLCAALFKQHGLHAQTQRCQEPYPPSFRCVFVKFKKRATARSSHPHLDD